MHSSDDRIRLADVREEALVVDEVVAAVDDARAGGVVVFVGRVRDHDHDRAVVGLEYTAHPSAADQLRAVAGEVLTPEVIAVAAVHRTGQLAVGDLAVVVAVAAAHRGVAFEVCEQLIDTLKARVPIWKHQLFRDGTDEWVGLA